MKLDIKLDVSNLFALHDIADIVKNHKITKEEGLNIYQKKLALTKFERGKATPEEFAQAKEDFLKELDEYAIVKLDENMSQQDFAVKVYTYNLLKAEYKDTDKSMMAYTVNDFIDTKNYNTFREMFTFLKELNLRNYGGLDEIVFTSARISAESVKAAKEFFRTIQNDYKLQNVMYFDFENLSPEQIQHKTEIYKVFADTKIDRDNLLDLLEHSDITYAPIIEVYNKISNSEYYQSLIKNGDFGITHIPFSMVSAKTIAENFDYITRISQELNSNFHSIASYELFEDTPPNKREDLVNEWIKEYKEGNSFKSKYLEGLVEKWQFEENYYTSTPQDQCENSLGLLRFIKNLKLHGFTDKELQNCTVETLFILNNMVSGDDVVFSPQERELLLSRNLDKRMVMLKVAPNCIKNNLISYSDEYFDKIANQIRNRSIVTDHRTLPEEDVDKILNMEQENYDILCKINDIINKAFKSSENRMNSIQLILSLSDEAFSRVLDRQDILINRNLTFELRKELFEMSDEEYAKKSVPIGEREVGEDIDAEEYRAEVQAMLDGSYTLDLSAYNNSRAKRAAEKAKSDSSRAISFDESDAIVPKPRQNDSQEIPPAKVLIDRLKRNREVSLSIPVKGELHPKGNADTGHIESEEDLGEFPTDTTLHYGEGRNWDNIRFVRDMLQNFYDGNGHTLEGVDIDIKYENGKFKETVYYDLDENKVEVN